MNHSVCGLKSELISLVYFIIKLPHYPPPYLAGVSG